MARLITLLAIVLVLGIPIAIGLVRPAAIASSSLAPHTANLENGQTMFFAGGCASCHASPDQDDIMRLGGGRELRTDFGTFRAPNISSHITDGIGNWTEADFVNAMLNGASPNAEHYYPAFPYTSYQRMSVADARDLFAFLKTLPAVEGRVPGHDLRFPYNLRAGIGFWKLRYLNGRRFQPDPSQSEQWNRGAYLVEALGHCAECHSPRDRFGGIVPEQRNAGGPNPTGEGFVPDITQHPDGLADWSEEDIAELLASGATPEFDQVGGEMALVVRNTARLSAEDRAAMAHYLKSLAPIASPRRN